VMLVISTPRVCGACADDLDSRAEKPPADLASALDRASDPVQVRPPDDL